MRGGQVFGTRDKRVGYPDQIARTVYHAMGVDELRAVGHEGRPFNLMEGGRAITELFGPHTPTGEAESG